jgi:electron transfer flavoprotein beta subunit
MSELNIIVCVKQIPDPEGPADSFKVDSEAKKMIPVGIPPVINPFDENALEVALRIKEHHTARVKVISMGGQLARPVLRKVLAAGADELILLEDPNFKDLDSFSTAYVLSRMIRRIGTYDLILTGRQAGDWDYGITGLLIAENLQIPGINLAQKVEIKDNQVLVEKLYQNGYEMVKVLMPALVTVSSEVGELRYTSVRALQAVSKKPIETYNAKDLEIAPERLEVREILELVPTNVRRECTFIEGASPQEKGESMAICMKKQIFY